MERLFGSDVVRRSALVRVGSRRRTVRVARRALAGDIGVVLDSAVVLADVRRFGRPDVDRVVAALDRVGA